MKLQKLDRSVSDFSTVAVFLARATPSSYFKNNSTCTERNQRNTRTPSETLFIPSHCFHLSHPISLTLRNLEPKIFHRRTAAPRDYPPSTPAGIRGFEEITLIRGKAFFLLSTQSLARTPRQRERGEMKGVWGERR